MNGQATLPKSVKAPKYLGPNRKTKKKSIPTPKRKAEFDFSDFEVEEDYCVSLLAFNNAITNDCSCTTLLKQCKVHRWPAYESVITNWGPSPGNLPECSCISIDKKCRAHRHLLKGKCFQQVIKTKVTGVFSGHNINSIIGIHKYPNAFLMHNVTSLISENIKDLAP